MTELSLNYRVQAMQPSATLGMAQASRDLFDKGIDVAMLSTGEPDFSTPQAICDVAKMSLDQGRTHYVPVRGTKAMISALQEKFLRDQKVSYAADEVMCTVGGKSAIIQALKAIVNEGDEVIVFAPFWVSYLEQIRLVGGIPIIIETRLADSFMPDGFDVARQVNKRTKAIILNSPNNPSGGVINRGQLSSIAEVLKDSGIWVISDEIYEKFLFDGHEHISPASLSKDMRNRTLVVSGTSKAYAMTGWRVGVCAGPKMLISAMEKLQGQDTTCLPEFIQDAAAFAFLENDVVSASIKTMVGAYGERKELGLSLFSQIPNVKIFKPQGAFYLWIDFSSYMGAMVKGQKINDDIDFATRMLKEAHVSTVPGTPFGGKGFLRLSMASHEDTIKDGYRRMRDWLKA